MGAAQKLLLNVGELLQVSEEANTWKSSLTNNIN